MDLTVKDIRLILEALSEQYGFGYSEKPNVGMLQAKLSIMLEIATKREGK